MYVCINMSQVYTRGQYAYFLLDRITEMEQLILKRGELLIYHTHHQLNCHDYQQVNNNNNNSKKVHLIKPIREIKNESVSTFFHSFCR